MIATTDLDVIATSDDGRSRVILEHERYPEQPDGDAYGYVFAVEYRHGYRVDMLHAPTGDPSADDIATALERALSRWGADWDRVERYLASLWDAVSVARYDRRDGGALLAVVTAGLCDAWGIPAGAPIRAESANLAEWEAWDEGDVWLYVIQTRGRLATLEDSFSVEDSLSTLEDSFSRCLVRLSSLGSGFVCASCGDECECVVCTHDADTWDDAETIGRFYGREWARESALEAFAGWLS